jgi:hypothetical protein
MALHSGFGRSVVTSRSERDAWDGEKAEPLPETNSQQQPT